MKRNIQVSIMKLDGIYLSSVSFEVKEYFIPSKIVDLYQLNHNEIQLVLKNKETVRVLHFSVRPDRMAFFLSDSPSPSVNISSLFFHQLMNWVQGATLRSIEHYQFDRIIRLTLEPYNRFGPAKQYCLITEFMGKHSNMILIDDQNKIKAALKTVDSNVNRYRTITLGEDYIDPPKQNKENLLLIQKDEFIRRFKKSKESGHPNFLWQFFQQNLNGMSAKSAQELLSFMNFSEQVTLDQFDEISLMGLWNQFRLVIDQIKNNKLSPVVYMHPEKNNIIDFTLFHSKIQTTNNKSLTIVAFKNTSSCLEFVFNRLKDDDKKLELFSEINKVLKKNIQKLSVKEEFFTKKQKEINASQEYRIKGELIKANLWNIKPGTESIDLIDFTNHQMPEINISLNPDLTPLQNAEYFFKKYKKLQQNKEILLEQAEMNHKTFKLLQRIQDKLVQKTVSLEELFKFKDKLVQLGFISIEKKSKSRNDTIPAIHRFVSGDGWTILAGKNNKQNEYILRQLSSGNDFWLHNQTRPGGHILIKNHKNLNNPPYNTLLFGAQLAAYYSKCKDEETAMIVYTQRKYVRKPRNSKPGKVIYTNEKTLPVKINYEEIKRNISHYIVD